MSKHLDSRGRLPQITGQVALDVADMLDGLEYRSLSDFLTSASWAYRRGFFQGTFCEITNRPSPVTLDPPTRSKPNPKPEIEYTPMFTEDGFTDDDED